MKLYFKNAEALMEGIALLRADLGFDIAAESEADVCITVTEQPEDGLALLLDGQNASIAYGGGAVRFYRALAQLVRALRDGKKTASVQEKPLFITNGAMVDMSRNAVMTVNNVKYMLRKMALMGLNTFMLYTEDTYEVENRPYFGYMRGRYTADEIREMDAYARKLGIELVPCVQFLGHLRTHLRWNAAMPYRDTLAVLRVGEEETYKLIDDMLRSIADCFSSRRIHIGMDETHDLGTGKYLELNGYRERQDIFFEHLGRVSQMCRDYGFRPMMWSDMFFRMSARGMENFRDYDPRTVLPDDIGKMLPEGVQPVFWDYYHPDESFYAVNLDKHDLLSDHTIFAGGIWTWMGPSLQLSRTVRNTIPALDACRKKGTKEIFATIWHNGSEANLITSLAGLSIYAEYDYKGYYDQKLVSEGFRTCCDARYEDFLEAELVDYPHGTGIWVGASRQILYNDPMLGMMDKHLEGFDTVSYYRELTPKLHSIGRDCAVFAPSFEMIEKLSDLLENKANFGVRLKAAYDAKDHAALAALAAECGVIMDKLGALRRAHHKAWMAYNKPFGWEVHDVRYGAQLMRFDTAREHILAYLAGELDCIAELEEDRLWLDNRKEGDTFPVGSFPGATFTALCTAGVL
ncbi:MAG: beta-N-acetylhexosaminidase [Ruminococcaceae bacterium]|nr:beta-N-acetylhexosaminidase [Oscillospiraceae bacterium]